MNDPAVVWADEPTGNLDSESAAEILDLIERLNRENGQTFVLVTHDPRVAERAERILRMRDGQIVAEESVRTVANDPPPPDPLPLARERGSPPERRDRAMNAILGVPTTTIAAVVAAVFFGGLAILAGGRAAGSAAAAAGAAQRAPPARRSRR